MITDDVLPITPNLEEEIINLIAEACNSANKKTCLYNLTKARHLCHQLIIDDNPNGFALLIEIIAEFASECFVPSERYNLWEECLREAFKAVVRFDDPAFVDRLAKKVVDFLQDKIIYVPVKTANKYLAAVKEKIDCFLSKLPDADQYKLLARKSALLRNMSKYQATHMAKIRMSHEALRCAQKAVLVNPESWDAHLELGVTFWHCSQFEKNDEKYNACLKSAEDSIWESITIEPTVYNLFAICHLYRLTYQTMPFLECFDLYAKHEHNKRQFLKSSYIYGEVVMQLWYSKYPASTVDFRLTDAARLLEEAIDAGFDDARHIIDLAFIKAAKGDIDVGIGILKKLHSSLLGTSWSEIARIVSGIQSGDELLAQGFALGIAESSVWNKLGTFAKTFLDDVALATQMYKEALSLNSANAVAMTNLSQCLILSDKPDAIQEANSWISKAASCAYPRFRWWRSVREEIKIKLETISITSSYPQASANLRFTNLSDLLKTFQRLKTFADHQARGYELERIVNRLFKISLGNSFSSYRTSLRWFASPTLQIDAAFIFFDRDFYIVETKWTSKPITRDDITIFRNRIDNVESKGLFISIAGFTVEAIRQAYEYRKQCQILLMDGEELEYILHGAPAFDEAMRIKQIYFAKESNPYFKIGPTLQLEIA